MKSKDFCLQIHFRTSFVLKFNVSIERKNFIYPSARKLAERVTSRGKNSD